MALWSFLSPPLLPPPISALTFLLILPFGQVFVCHVMCERRRNGTRRRKASNARGPSWRTSGRKSVRKKALPLGTRRAIHAPRSEDAEVVVWGGEVRPSEVEDAGGAAAEAEAMERFLHHH